GQEGMTAFIVASKRLNLEDLQIKSKNQQHYPIVHGGFEELLSLEEKFETESRIRNLNPISNLDNELDTAALFLEMVLSDRKLIANKAFMLEFVKEVQQNRSKP